MDRLHPEVLSTLNRHQRTLVGEAFGDMVEAHQTHTQALKNSLEDVLEESRCVCARMRVIRIMIGL